LVVDQPQKHKVVRTGVVEPLPVAVAVVPVVPEKVKHNTEQTVV
jgi:hypothetical protein